MNLGISPKVMFYSDTTILLIGTFLGACIIIILFIWVNVQCSDIMRQSMSPSQVVGFYNQRHSEISDQLPDIILGKSTNPPYMSSPSKDD